MRVRAPFLDKEANVKCMGTFVVDMVACVGIKINLLHNLFEEGLPNIYIQWTFFLYQHSSCWLALNYLAFTISGLTRCFLIIKTDIVAHGRQRMIYGLRWFVGKKTAQLLQLINMIDIPRFDTQWKQQIGFIGGVKDLFAVCYCVHRKETHC